MKNNIFDLPCFDHHKSFYGKAVVTEKPNGDKLLKSYDTVVCSIDAQGRFHRLWDGFSATTMRHVNSFLSYYGLPFGGKAFWNAAPVEQPSRALAA